MTALFGAILPRLLIFAGWYNDPTYWGGLLGSGVWLLGGFLFFPSTTVIYGLVQANGMSLFNWLFLGGAFLVDLGNWGIGVFAARDAYSSYRD